MTTTTASDKRRIQQVNSLSSWRSTARVLHSTPCTHTDLNTSKCLHSEVLRLATWKIGTISTLLNNRIVIYNIFFSFLFCCSNPSCKLPFHTIERPSTSRRLVIAWRYFLQIFSIFFFQKSSIIGCCCCCKWS